MSVKMWCTQWIFIVIHSLVYADLIFYRDKMIFVGKREKMKEGMYGKTHKLSKGRVLAIEHGILLEYLINEDLRD